MSDVNGAALYYPHDAIQDSGLLKTSLLLWDYVESVTPPIQKCNRRISPEAAAATELIFRRRQPPDGEQLRVHERVMAALAAGTDWTHMPVGRRPFYADGSYRLHASTLAAATWNELLRLGLAIHYLGAKDEYVVPSALGFLLLGVLADECAGEKLTRLTDRSEAYGALFDLVAGEMSAVDSAAAPTLAESFDRLVTLSVRIINPDEIPLPRLLAARQREQRERSGDLRAFRRRYLAAISAHVTALTEPELTRRDREEIEREFILQMTRDLYLLKEELGFAAREVMFSKEVAVCTVAGAGTLLAGSTTATIAGLGAAGVAALLSGRTKYVKARVKALREHAMSWLYSV